MILKILLIVSFDLGSVLVQSASFQFSRVRCLCPGHAVAVISPRILHQNVGFLKTVAFFEDFFLKLLAYAWTQQKACCIRLRPR